MATHSALETLLTLALLLFAAVAPAGASIKGCGAPSNAPGCACEWAKDETDESTFQGLSNPVDYTPAQIKATGLLEAVVKAAGKTAAGCERVCCEALAITDAPAEAQAPPQTGACGIWQYMAPPKGNGCWLGLDNSKRKPPLPTSPSAGQLWIGASGNLGKGSNWGWAVLITCLVVTVVYLSGGVVHGVKVRGVPPGPEALPHREQWASLLGLVVDGCTLIVERLKKLKNGDAAAPLDAPLVAEDQVEEGKAEEEGAGDSGSDVAD